MTRLLATISGAAVGIGLVLIIAGFIAAPEPAADMTSASGLGGPSWPRRLLVRLLRVGLGPVDTANGPQALGRGWVTWRWPIALLSALAVLLMSGWPVAAVLVAVIVVGLPALFATGSTSGRAIEKAEAIQEWTRRLADVLVVGVGLEQAITATAQTCPRPLEPAVTALAGRLSAQRQIEDALRLFADDLNDAAGDLVVATLILGSRRRGPGLARALTAAADSLADEVATRRKVEAERAKPRTTARAVTVITLLVAAVGSLNHTYLRPYGTPLGQLVLAGLAGCYLAALGWMHSMTRPPVPPRILAPAGRSTREGER